MEDGNPFYRLPDPPEGTHGNEKTYAQRLAEFAFKRTWVFQPGETILAPEDIGWAAYLINGGIVEMVKQNAHPDSSLLGFGHMPGILGLVEDLQHVTVYRAVTPVKTLKIVAKEKDSIRADVELRNWIREQHIQWMMEEFEYDSLRAAGTLEEKLCAMFLLYFVRAIPENMRRAGGNVLLAGLTQAFLMERFDIKQTAMTEAFNYLRAKKVLPPYEAGKPLSLASGAPQRIVKMLKLSPENSRLARLALAQ